MVDAVQFAEGLTTQTDVGHALRMCNTPAESTLLSLDPAAYKVVFLFLTCQGLRSRRGAGKGAEERSEPGGGIHGDALLPIKLSQNLSGTSNTSGISCFICAHLISCHFHALDLRLPLKCNTSIDPCVLKHHLIDKQDIFFSISNDGKPLAEYQSLVYIKGCGGGYGQPSPHWIQTCLGSCSCCGESINHVSHFTLFSTLLPTSSHWP